MKMILLLVAFFGFIAPPTRGTGGPLLVLKRAIQLPDVRGRMDHLAYDPFTKRLFVAALENGSLEVIDLEKGERIKSVSGLKEPQGIVYVAQTRQVVTACGGDGMVVAFDAETLDEKQRLDVGDDADNIRLESDGKTLIVGHDDGALSIFDAHTFKKSGEVKLPGHPESFQLEPGSTRIFINVPGGAIGGGGELMVADMTIQKTPVMWKLKEAGRNFPMAVDGVHKRLYVGCRRPAKLVVFDTESGNVVASPECIGDADDVFVDPQTGHVLVIGGDGAIDVFESKDDRTYVKASSLKTAEGARTGLLVPERSALFVAVPKRTGQQTEIREYTLVADKARDLP
jgi:DNA-binding beta-propeller fold protein YncE